MPKEKQPPVSLDRWLVAALIGERCQDKTALEFAREQKQLVTTTSGILLPEAFQREWIDLVRSQMVLNACGMTTMVMTAKTVNASALASDPSVTWHQEAGTINVGNPTFEARQLVAKTAVVRCQSSL